MKRSKDELIIRQLFDDEGFYQGYEETGKLVRCKDCKDFQPFVGERKKVNTTKNGWCSNGDSVKYDDFCSYGERRSE